MNTRSLLREKERERERDHQVSDDGTNMLAAIRAANLIYDPAIV